jgi:hypothetical protein
VATTFTITHFDQAIKLQSLSDLTKTNSDKLSIGSVISALPGSIGKLIEFPLASCCLILFCIGKTLQIT